MTTDNRQLTRTWFNEVWNKRRSDVIEQMLDPSARIHGLGEDRIGPQMFAPFHQQFLGAFPDLSVEVDDVIGDGERTAARFTVRGTHRGDHLGFAATGKPIVATGLCYIHWKDGRIVEAWNEFDSAGTIQALR